MAEIEYDVASLAESGDFGLAEAAADRAIAADPDNVMAMAYKARIAGQRALASDEPAGYWDEARKWIRRANRADPAQPLPFVLFYDSFVAQGKDIPEGAVKGLYAAMPLIPQDGSLSARVAVELIKSGNIARAREVLAPAAFSPHAPRESSMRDLIAEIDAGKSATELEQWIKENKFDLQFNDFVGSTVARELAEKKKGKEDGES